MTKKDYELIAQAFRSEQQAIMLDLYRNPATAKAVLVEIAYKLATRFADQNERFDTRRFLTACGIED